ncbi:Glucose-6-phosphatase 2 [Zootermopsis nevadensis]|uniref:glucose-6-phosphatase n=1 Tax=Zootermopsis nevadensis TaxID=136037 RepID=A0A067QMF8_ZOONE|nr:Glucose-6-phosphatase 2 [Zootermopsis nevadensis]
MSVLYCKVTRHLWFSGETMNISEEVRRLGALGIKSIQTTFPRGDNFFFSISYFADPLYSFTYLVPLTAGLNTGLAADMLMVSIMAEWFNTLLKWLLMDHRPFWWVHETNVYGKGLRPLLRQTPLTCETGPGSPSGHVQGASSLMYVVLQHVIRTFIVSSKKMDGSMKRYVRVTLWTLYTLLMILVSISRLYTATHFPHQTLLGLVAGLFTAWLFIEEGQYTLTERWRSASRLQMLLGGVAMIAVSFGAYWLQRLLGVDPQWSVRLAFKWCEQPDWIHVNTTPLFSLVRDCGSMFGLAMASPATTRIYKQTHNNIIITMICTLFLMVAFNFATDAVPTSDVRLFYVCQFILHAVKPYLLFIGIPQVARFVKQKQH